MKTMLKVLTAATVLALVASAALHAAGQARVFGTITDENGQPIPEVTLVVTTPENTSYRMETTTDGKGFYQVTLIDATRPYDYRFEKEGYQTVQATRKVGINSNTEHSYTMLSSEAMEEQAQAAAAGTAAGIYNAGVEALRAGDVAAAEAKFKEAAEMDATLAAPWVALATLYLTNDRAAEAASAAEKAIEIDGGNVNALRARYNAYRELGDEVKTEEAATALAAADSSSGAGILLGQATEKFNAGDTDGARQLLEQALEADPELSKAHYLLGLCLVAGEPAKAKEHFERFLELTPDDPDAGTAKEMISYL